MASLVSNVTDDPEAISSFKISELKIRAYNKLAEILSKSN